MTLIKQEDAIEAIKKEIQDFEANYMHGEDDEEYGHDIGFVAGLHTAKTFIRSLPSAEPSGDLISRKETLKELKQWFHSKGWMLSDEDVESILWELPSAEAETVDCTDFIRWLTEAVMDDGMWELNAVAYGEVIARKLTKLGVLEVKDDVYVYKPSAEVRTKCVAQIKVDTEEIVRRIKEEYDMDATSEAVQRGW